MNGRHVDEKGRVFVVLSVTRSTAPVNQNRQAETPRQICHEVGRERFRHISRPCLQSRETISETHFKSWARTKVWCVSGYRANERPLSFFVDESEIKVRTILESWRGPDYFCFKVGTRYGRVYDLLRHEYRDRWQVRQSARIQFPGRSTRNGDRLIAGESASGSAQQG